MLTRHRVWNALNLPLKSKRLGRHVLRLLRSAFRRTTLNDRYDAQTLAVIKRVLGRRSSAIDVGLHTGAILDNILRAAPEGDHYGFEPLPDLFAAAVAKYAAAGKLHLFNAALGDASGSTQFQHVVTNPAYSGILRRRYDRPHEEVVEITVSLMTLDDVLPPAFDVRFIKIDVEGAELQVLRGAAQTLSRCRPFVVFEHGLGAADAYGTEPEMVFDLLTGCGLGISLMHEWLRSGPQLSREALAEEFTSGRNYVFLAHP